MTTPRVRPKRSRPEAKCPLRPDEICNLCQLDVTGPHDCGLVYLVMSDPDQRVEWGERRATAAEARRLG